MSGSTSKPKGIRRVERRIVGLAMALVAFVLEKLVMRSVRRKGAKADPPPAERTSITTRGGDVALP